MRKRNGPMDTGSVSAIDGMLATARAGLDRVRPENLADEVAAGALIIDIRPVEQRQHDGTLDGALVIDRNVLEWRLDPSCAHHIPQITDPAQRIVVVCNEGYSSSLAAATLRDLGLSRATDLAGGFQAWRAIVTDRESAQPRTRSLGTPAASTTVVSEGTFDPYPPPPRAPAPTTAYPRMSG